MQEELSTVLSELGPDGIQALYVYLACDTGLGLLFMGLIVWGVRTAWPSIKKSLED